jgi:acetyl esterase/lipase
VVVLPGGGYAQHAAHEGEPIAQWLEGLGVAASVFHYPLMVRHPAPLNALRTEIRRLRDRGATRIGLIGFSAGGHLAGLAALADGANSDEAVDFAVLGYPITSMETEAYRPSRLILLRENATPELRRATSLNALVTRSSPPFFVWHTAEDEYLPPEHTYRLAASLAAHDVPHAVHVFAHGHTASAWRSASATRRHGQIWRSSGSENRATIKPEPTERSDHDKHTGTGSDFRANDLHRRYDATSYG